VEAAEDIAAARAAAERGEHAKAARILDRRQEASVAAGLAGDERCAELVAELRELSARVADRREYEQTGRACLLAGMSSHALRVRVHGAALRVRRALGIAVRGGNGILARGKYWITVRGFRPTAGVRVTFFRFLVLALSDRGNKSVQRSGAGSEIRVLLRDAGDAEHGGIVEEGTRAAAVGARWQSLWSQVGRAEAGWLGVYHPEELEFEG